MPASSGAAAGLGLLAAATWGGSDFAGGWGARRASPVLITAAGQVVSLVVLFAICLALRIALPASSYLIYGAIGGFEGAFALAIASIARWPWGAMGLTAALTGLLTALVPVIFDLQGFTPGLPGAAHFRGIGGRSGGDLADLAVGSKKRARARRAKLYCWVHAPDWASARS